MKLLRIIIFVFLALLDCSTAFSQVKLVSDGTLPHITVNGKPMVMLAGELSNSAATSKADIDKNISSLSYISNLNTILVPAQWDLIEPEEGKFDFSLIDESIKTARQNNMKIVFLWFGAWKNSMSCYAPLWFKKDTKRFPRAVNADGKQLEIASAFSPDVLKADMKAFTSLLRHIASVDGSDHTVVMIQVENEIGMLESARDHSPLAEKAYKSGEWKKICSKVKLNSDDQRYVDETFQAYYYARYVEQLAIAGKKILDIPFYVNAAMNSRGRKPGEYPSAGPLAHLFPIWKTVAPHIDLCAPDIYDTGFKGWASRYDTEDNTLFIPESRMSVNSGVRGLYTIGEHHAIGFSPFAIDEAPKSQQGELDKAYSLIHQMSSYAFASKKAKSMWGLLFSQDDKERIINDGNTVLTCRHFFTLPWDPRATSGEQWPEGGAIVMKMADNEYLIAGSGIVVEFKTKSEKQQEVSAKTGEDGFALAGNAEQKTKRTKMFKGHRLGIGFVDQVSISDDGTLQYIRRDNGDQDHQGRHARISVGDYKILHVKLYEY